MTELNGIVLSRLPVLPLRGLTAFPNMIVHFDVGRMMSIRALEAAMKNGQTIFLTAQRELKTDTPTPSDLYQIGTICQIRQILRLPGDNIRVLVEGKTRALAHNFIAAEKDEDCMYAEVEELEDYVYGVTERRAQALVRTAQERFGEYAQYASRLSPDVELTVAEGGDPGYLADYIAQNIPVDVAAKQEILEDRQKPEGILPARADQGHSDRARRAGRSRRSGKLPRARARPQAAEGVRGQAHP